jgi:hypothetical protein
MKKFIALATLLFAFTVSANAQDKRQSSSSEEDARNDVKALNEKIKLNDQLQADMYTLMLMKHQELNNTNQMAPIDKTAMGKKIENKIVSSLDEVQRKELAKYPELMQRLTH